MSKAFTKEDGNSTDDELDFDDEETSSLPQGQKNYMTPEGYARLREELHKLLNVDRPETVRTVAWAASNGDRSENGDYIYGKRRLREIDRRIRFLTKRIEQSEVVDPTKAPLDRVVFGAWVKYSNEDGVVKTIRIVGIDESVPAKGHISWISPLGKALLQAKKGEAVAFHTPKGEEEIEVIDFWYVEKA